MIQIDAEFQLNSFTIFIYFAALRALRTIKMSLLNFVLPSFYADTVWQSLEHEFDSVH